MAVAVVAAARWQVSADRVRRTLVSALRRLRRPGFPLSVALVDRRTATRLNRQYRGRNSAANVLSFPLAAKHVRGEIVLCPTVAAAEAQRFGRTRQQHLDALAVHGLLHLLGYDHHQRAERQRMERLERRLLARST